MKLLPTIKKSIIAFALLPALLYAGIPPTLQSDASQRMTRDIMDRAYITPKRIVTKYAGCKNNLIKDEHYLLERGNGQSEMNRKKCCIMTSTETEKASLLLDFGSELHGGLKLVAGSSSRREPSLVRIPSLYQGSSISFNTLPISAQRSFTTSWFSSKERLFI